MKCSRKQTENAIKDISLCNLKSLTEIILIPAFKLSLWVFLMKDFYLAGFSCGMYGLAKRSISSFTLTMI